MAKKLRTSQLKLIILLGTIFFVCMALSLAFFVTNYVSLQTEQLKENTERIAQLIADEVDQGTMFAFERYAGDLQVLIIDRKEGELRYERQDEPGEDRRLWESHRSKLIYLMQKQKSGWIDYPEAKPWQFFREQKTIRFLTVESADVVVAVERRRPSIFNMILGAVPLSLLVKLFGVFLFGVFGVVYFTDRYISSIKRKITHDVESDFMTINNENVFNKSQIDETVEDYIGEDEPGGDKGPVQEEESLDELVMGKSVEPPAVSGAKDAPSEETETPSSGPKKEDAEIIGKVEHKDSSPQREPEEKAVPEDSPYDDMTIDIQGIKSPLLKKMIKKLRNR